MTEWLNEWLIDRLSSQLNYINLIELFNLFPELN